MAARIALCHEWVTTWGGSEQVAGRIADALAVDDIFTFALDEATARRTFGDRHVHASKLGRSSFAVRHWQWLLPVMDRWWRSLDLASYDVVITNSHAAVNAVRVHGDTVHISYCLTPMRYAWEWRKEAGRVPPAVRPLFPIAAAALRRADRKRARNVDLFIATSRNVQERVRRRYGRTSIVIYPPVRTEFFTPDPDVPRERFFLCAGRLVPYKRTERAILAANVARFDLVIAGAGPELERLRRLAGPTVSFRPSVDDGELRHLYRTCRALLFCGNEDFGIVPVEAQACGAPVIALARGGALESVQDGITGVLYAEDSVDALRDAVTSFDAARFSPDAARANAERFSVRRFDEEIRSLVAEVLDVPAERRRQIVRTRFEQDRSAQ